MLTERQSQLLAFIKSHQQEKGFSPSYEEIKTAINLHSKSGVHRMVDALQSSGFLKRRAGRNRSIELLRDPQQSEREAKLLGVLRQISDLSVLRITADPDLPRSIARSAL